MSGVHAYRTCDVISFVSRLRIIACQMLCPQMIISGGYKQSLLTSIQTLLLQLLVRPSASF